MCRKLGVCGGAEHKGALVDRSTEISTKRKVSDPDFVQKFLSPPQSLVFSRVLYQIWCHLMPEPRHLALGILAGVVDGDATGFLQLELAAEMAKQLGRAMRLEAGPLGVGLALENGARLGQHTRFQHGVEARADALAQPGAVGSEQQGGERPRR